ncbi:MAG TPA: GGDEF domain-containing protein [Burkholderiaceae bacterium]|nr:GGDEF domain-containing protein [Burkholderiaceae bacterium]
MPLADPAAFVSATVLVGLVVTGMLVAAGRSSAGTRGFLAVWVAADLVATIARGLELPRSMAPAIDVAWAGALPPYAVEIAMLSLFVLAALLHAAALALLARRAVTLRSAIAAPVAVALAFAGAVTLLADAADRTCLAAAAIGSVAALGVAAAWPLVPRFLGAKLVAAVCGAVALYGLGLAATAFVAPLSNATAVPTAYVAADLLTTVGLGIGVLMTLQERLHARIQQLSVTDALTGALNRRGMLPQLEREWIGAYRYRRPLALALIDIDRFKRINETFGEARGDDTLAQLVALIRLNTRQSDLLARWGGEAFLLVLPGTTGREARLALDRLRAGIAASPLVAGLPPVSISVGVAALDATRPRSALTTLLAAADRCLGAAKAQRNCVVLDESNASPATLAAAGAPVLDEQVAA